MTQSILRMDVSEIFRLWMSELSSALSDCGSLLKRLNGPAIALVYETDVLRLVRLRRGRVVEVARFDAEASRQLRKRLKNIPKGRRQTLDAWLRPEQVLRERLTLPSAVRTNLKSAAAYQIAAVSPFAPEDVLFHARVLSEAAPDNQIAVELILVPKAIVDEIQQKAASIGLAINRVVVANGTAARDSAEAIEISLRDAPQIKPASRLLMGLLAIALFAAFAGVPIWKSRNIQSQLQGEKQRLQSSVQEIRLISDSMASAESMQSELAKSIANSAPVNDILERLSTALDDETYLTALKIDGSAVTLSGLSKNASGVLQAIET